MELFENIMSRTNTVFPEAQKTGVDNKNLIAANNFGNTFRKIAILIVTLSMLLCLCQLPTTTSAASIHKVTNFYYNIYLFLSSTNLLY